jgi:DNA polymerase sigma
MSEILIEVARDLMLKDDTKKLHGKLCSDLEIFLAKTLTQSHLKIELFGSSKSGFGCDDCDLDMTVTAYTNLFNNIRRFADAIRSFSQTVCGSVEEVPTAKVPIIKFDCRVVDSDGSARTFSVDLSFGNNLGVKNTALLKKYADFDERVPILGILVKKFTKQMNICGVKQRFMAPYAYTIMLIYFLQRKKVLPNFQEEEFPVFRRCNYDSVYDLLKGFLNYYSGTSYHDTVFDDFRDVVCIRRTKILSRAEKRWHRTIFNVEDPFKLDHNLGRSVDHDSLVLIKISFKMILKHLNSLYPLYALPSNIFEVSPIVKDC